MVSIKIDKLERIIINMLVNQKVTNEDAKIIADTIIFAHRCGKGTHGITRLPIYLKKIKNGSLNPKNDINIVRSKGVVTVLDANNGFGQIAAYRAMEHAIHNAKKFGIGVVGVRNSNNFGTASYFLNQAISADMIGIVMANSAPAIAPWGGKKPLLGTNPMGYGFPTTDDLAPIIFDMATSIAARGKIRLAAKQGNEIPLGWALDQNGKPTNNPLEALKGTLIPIGEHKGSGLALVVDILAGLISGSAFGGGVKPLNTDGDFSKNGHFLMTINIDFFMDSIDYYNKIRQLLHLYKNKGGPRAQYPGENAYKQFKSNSKEIKLSNAVIRDINENLKSLNTDLLEV